MISISTCRDIEEARRFSAPERKVLKADVKAGLSSLISGSVARNIRDTKRPSMVDIYTIYIDTCYLQNTSYQIFMALV